MDKWTNQLLSPQVSASTFSGKRRKSHVSSPWDVCEGLSVTPLGSPALASCSVWFCLLQQGLGVTTQHNSASTYGKAIWNLVPTEGEEKEMNGITTLLESYPSWSYSYFSIIHSEAQVKIYKTRVFGISSPDTNTSWTPTEWKAFWNTFIKISEILPTCQS